jgi:lipopolysaccharide export system permease protein
VFFIIFYVISITGEKWAKENLVEVHYGMWTANFILLLVGFVFLRQARNDSALFETDFYAVAWGKFKRLFARKQEA